MTVRTPATIGSENIMYGVQPYSTMWPRDGPFGLITIIGWRLITSSFKGMRHFGQRSFIKRSKDNARRIAGLSKGRNKWLKRRIPTPVAYWETTAIFRFRAICSTRSRVKYPASVSVVACALRSPGDHCGRCCVGSRPSRQPASSNHRLIHPTGCSVRSGQRFI
jgi:hypothetical protein